MQPMPPQQQAQQHYAALYAQAQAHAAHAAHAAAAQAAAPGHFLFGGTPHQMAVYEWNGQPYVFALPAPLAPYAGAAAGGALLPTIPGAWPAASYPTAFFGGGAAGGTAAAPPAASDVLAAMAAAAAAAAGGDPAAAAAHARGFPTRRPR